MTKTPWFGDLLDWRWDPQTEQHVTWHNNRSHSIVKLASRAANDRRTSPGWHLIQDDGWGQPDIGVHLGSDVATAKMNAEAWIVCAESDMRQYPSLNIAMYSGGVAYERWDIRRDIAGRQFVVHDRASDVVVGWIRPVFLGRGGACTIRWRAFQASDLLVSGGDSWSDAVTDLAAAIAEGAAA